MEEFIIKAKNKSTDDPHETQTAAESVWQVLGADRDVANTHYDRTGASTPYTFACWTSSLLRERVRKQRSMEWTAVSVVVVRTTIWRSLASVAFDVCHTSSTT